MPRHYVRKNEDYGRIPHDIMQLAVNDVLANGISVRQAAKNHNIPRGTLRNNLKKSEMTKRLEVTQRDLGFPAKCVQKPLIQTY